jgi:hypothetical protein
METKSISHGKSLCIPKQTRTKYHENREKLYKARAFSISPGAYGGSVKTDNIQGLPLSAST